MLLTVVCASGAVGGGLWYSHRYGWWRPTVDYGAPRLLMYHMVCEPVRKGRFNKMRVRPSAFEAQLAWLRQKGWQFRRMTDVARGDCPEKTVVLTFDDGFADNYYHAFPLLEKYDACATLYLVVYRHQNDWAKKKKAYRNNGELVREAKLSDDQVSRMIASGRFELGSHTLTHPDLRKLSNDAKEEEIVQSKKVLESTFDCPVESFAFPFGLYDDEDVAMVKRAGYSTAVTTNSGIDASTAEPMELKRIKVSGKDGLHAFGLRMRTGLRGMRA